MTIIYPTTSSNTPAVETSGTALASNPQRIGWSIQNQGTNPLFVLLGSGCTTSVYHYTLKGASVAADGSGGSVAQTEGVVFTGAITVAGTSPSYTVLEMAP